MTTDEAILVGIKYSDDNPGNWDIVGDYISPEPYGLGVVQLGDNTDAGPAEVKAEALALKDQIAKGDYHPFTGPLNKQDGSVWLKDGEKPEDSMLSGLNFYVQGIAGDLPK